MINLLVLFALKFVETVLSSCYDSRNHDNWAIGVFFGKSPLSMCEKTSGPSVPVLTCEHITDVEAEYVADPFLYIPQNTTMPWYMFFEVLNAVSGKGEIGVAVSNDQVRLNLIIMINNK